MDCHLTANSLEGRMGIHEVPTVLPSRGIHPIINDEVLTPPPGYTLWTPSQKIRLLSGSSLCVLAVHPYCGRSLRALGRI